MSTSYEEIMGSPIDPGDHPATNVPQATQHYAGEVVDFPISLQQADARRMKSMNINKMVKPNYSAPILKGPGAD